MKRIISLVIGLLLLSGCNKAEVAPTLNGITFNADITYYNESYKGECSVSEEGVMTLKITEPEVLSGYTLTAERDKMTAEYLGLSFTPTQNNMVFSGVFGDIYNCFCEIIDTKSNAKKTGDAYELSGGKESKSYTLTVSPTGLPQSLMLPDERFALYFYNVTVK